MKKVNLPKRGAGRRLAARLKKLAEQQPSRDTVDKVNSGEQSNTSISCQTCGRYPFWCSCRVYDTGSTKITRFKDKPKKVKADLLYDPTKGEITVNSTGVYSYGHPLNPTVGLLTKGDKFIIKRVKR